MPTRPDRPEPSEHLRGPSGFSSTLRWSGYLSISNGAWSASKDMHADIVEGPRPRPAEGGPARRPTSRMTPSSKSGSSLTPRVLELDRSDPPLIRSTAAAERLQAVGSCRRRWRASGPPSSGPASSARLAKPPPHAVRAMATSSRRERCVTVSGRIVVLLARRVPKYVAATRRTSGLPPLWSCRRVCEAGRCGEKVRRVRLRHRSCPPRAPGPRVGSLPLAARRGDCCSARRRHPRRRDSGRLVLLACGVGSRWTCSAVSCFGAILAGRGPRMVPGRAEAAWGSVCCCSWSALLMYAARPGSSCMRVARRPRAGLVAGRFECVLLVSAYRSTLVVLGLCSGARRPPSRTGRPSAGTTSASRAILASTRRRRGTACSAA